MVCRWGFCLWEVNWHQGPSFPPRVHVHTHTHTHTCCPTCFLTAVCMCPRAISVPFSISFWNNWSSVLFCFVSSSQFGKSWHSYLYNLPCPLYFFFFALLCNLLCLLKTHSHIDIASKKMPCRSLVRGSAINSKDLQLKGALAFLWTVRAFQLCWKAACGPAPEPLPFPPGPFWRLLYCNLSELLISR